MLTIENNTVYIGTECSQCETIYNEYKEFTLSVERLKNLDIEDIQKYNKGYMDCRLSDIINDSILEHIEKYFSKYYTSFNNTIDIEEGILSIGIHDANIITGIPIFNYENNKDILYKNIYDCILKQYKNIYDEDNINIKCITNVDINIITLKKKILTYDDKLKHIIICFNNIQKIYKKNQRILEQYKKRHIKWNYLMCLYGMKLTTVLNNKNIKKEFVSYINLYYRHLLKSYDDINTINITDYKKRSVILLHENYDFLLKKFKDDMREELKKIKPIRPNLSYKVWIETEYFRLSRLISNINSFVINKNITYVVIQIKILNSKYNKKIYYIKDHIVKLQKRVINIKTNTPENYNFI